MPKHAFDERFQLLQDSGQVGQEAVEITQSLIQKLERSYRLSLDEDNGGMFVSHVVIALQRLIDGHALDAPPAVVLNEARSLAEWPEAQALAARLGEGLGRTFPEGEVGYLTLHLARLKQEAKE